MNKEAERTLTTVIPYSPDNKWRFVRTKQGVEYCVEQLLFKAGNLEELVCYHIDDDGISIFVRLKPQELEDLSEVAEFLHPQEA